MAEAPDGPIRSEREAAAWLESLINVERRPDWPYRRLGLEPVRRLLARLGDPQDGLPILHVAGSKGKGSTVLLAEAVVRAAGLRSGAFTSPHLERWTERFRLEGREVEEARLADAVERVRPHVEALRAADPEHAPTFFDATTADALLLFREAALDAVLLEVGLGGRLDSTNVVRPRATCITSIELEHTDRLGTTLAAIAGEKAGIAKPGVPLVVGDLAPEAREVVAARAAEVGAPAAWLGRDFRVEASSPGPEGTSLYFRDGPLEVSCRLAVPGAHHAANAALAIAGVRRAGFVDDAALTEAAARGLASVALPGRTELLRREPWVVVDGAHTAASARALAAFVAPLPASRRVLVLSVSADKDLAAILEALLPLATEVHVTRAEAARSLAPAEIATAVRAAAPGLAVRVVPNPHLALRAAAEGLAPDALLCVAGSVYLAGIARQVLRGPAPAERVAVTRRAPGPLAGG